MLGTKQQAETPGLQEWTHWFSNYETQHHAAAGPSLTLRTCALGSAPVPVHRRVTGAGSQRLTQQQRIRLMEDFGESPFGF